MTTPLIRVKLSDEQIREIERLASLWAKARVRYSVFSRPPESTEKKAGRTEQDMRNRVTKSYQHLNNYLKDLRLEEVT